LFGLLFISYFNNFNIKGYRMKLIVKLASLRAALLVLLPTIFVPAVYAAGGTGDAKITGTYISASGAVRVLRIELNIAKVNPDSCSGTYGQTTQYPTGQALLIRELDDSKAAAQFLSMVQLAYATDANVSFWLVGCTSSAANYWGGTWPMPADIYMRK
jgi:hypothetical protein